MVCVSLCGACVAVTIFSKQCGGKTGSLVICWFAGGDITYCIVVYSATFVSITICMNIILPYAQWYASSGRKPAKSNGLRKHGLLALTMWQTFCDIISIWQVTMWRIHHQAVSTQPILMETKTFMMETIFWGNSEGDISVCDMGGVKEGSDRKRNSADHLENNLPLNNFKYYQLMKYDGGKWKMTWEGVNGKTIR